ncbi:hypothetical protein STIAU_2655 [Stigmatella aurantiaca DW4/3-1]|uniref:Uncharacterized protein n=1 Tax=Stigmatella aurantiaca (strain DW4/3-1) TaxID=378806 RepID=Q094E7_STIAD|nr:hypothetical protein STIAU_2655 [Stigmatella aurantiaca DW4/3-1]
MALKDWAHLPLMAKKENAPEHLTAPGALLHLSQRWISVSQ